MNATVKKAWIKALRSGKYAQGQNQLRFMYNEFEDTGVNKFHDEFCCLGVLCDLTLKRPTLQAALHGRWESGGYFVVPDDSLPNGKDSSATTLPMPLLALLGIRPDDADKLANLNDGAPYGTPPVKPKSFRQIANWIEKNL